MEDENVEVHKAACAAMCKVLVKLPRSQVSALVVPLITELCAAVWFSKRLGACELIRSAYPLCKKEEQLLLLNHVVQLSNDDMPLVKQAIFTTLIDFVSVVKSQALILSHLLPAIVLQANDVDAQLRVFSVLPFTACAPHLDAASISSSILPLLAALVDDKSWLIRKKISLAMPLLCKTIHVSALPTTLSHFAVLLDDNQIEVINAALDVLAEVGQAVCEREGGKEALQSLVAPACKRAASCSAESTRIALSRTLGEFGCCVDAECVVSCIFPLVEIGCADANFTVRQHAAHNLLTLRDHCEKKGGPCFAWVGRLQELCSDEHWRVRLSVLEGIEQLSASSIPADLFADNFMKLIVPSLTDTIWCIREKASAVIGTPLPHTHTLFFSCSFFVYSFFFAFFFFSFCSVYLRGICCL